MQEKCLLADSMWGWNGTYLMVLADTMWGWNGTYLMVLGDTMWDGTVPT